MHSVARPRSPRLRRSSWTSVTTIRAPLAPIGWPSATAPPWTLNCCRGNRRSAGRRSTPRRTPRCARPGRGRRRSRPTRVRCARTVGIGDSITSEGRRRRPRSSGATRSGWRRAARPPPRSRGRARRPRRRAGRSCPPSGRRPVGRTTERSRPRRSIVVESPRGPRHGEPQAPPGRDPRGTATVSAANVPSTLARAAARWLRSANSSTSARQIRTSGRPARRSGPSARAPRRHRAASPAIMASSSVGAPSEAPSAPGRRDEEGGARHALHAPGDGERDGAGT